MYEKLFKYDITSDAFMKKMDGYDGPQAATTAELFTSYVFSWHPCRTAQLRCSHMLQH